MKCLVSFGITSKHEDASAGLSCSAELMGSRVITLVTLKILPYASNE